LPGIPLTANLAIKAGGQHGIIAKHKYDETPCPATPNLQPLDTQATETKKAPDY
jgi:hypothetical protein